MLYMSLLKKTKIMLMAAFILGIAAKPSLSAVFNVASDFSVTNNPNGAWRLAGHQALDLTSTCIATQES
jgi:hypothetical protein